VGGGVVVGGGGGGGGGDRRADLPVEASVGPETEKRW